MEVIKCRGDRENPCHPHSSTHPARPVSSSETNTGIIVSGGICGGGGRAVCVCGVADRRCWSLIWQTSPNPRVVLEPERLSEAFKPTPPALGRSNSPSARRVVLKSRLFFALTIIYAPSRGKARGYNGHIQMRGGGGGEGDVCLSPS